jgi:hypothetical protein
MKRIAAFVGLSMVISGFCTVAAQDKKYAIKSGIITFDVTQKLGDIENKSRNILYFDGLVRKNAGTAMLARPYKAHISAMERMCIT